MAQLLKWSPLAFKSCPPCCKLWSFYLVRLCPEMGIFPLRDVPIRRYVFTLDTFYHFALKCCSLLSRQYLLRLDWHIFWKKLAKMLSKWSSHKSIWIYNHLFLEKMSGYIKALANSILMTKTMRNIPGIKSWFQGFLVYTQCDQIWRFIWLSTTFKCFWKHLICQISNILKEFLWRCQNLSFF